MKETKNLINQVTPNMLKAWENNYIEGRSLEKLLDEYFMGVRKANYQADAPLLGLGLVLGFVVVQFAPLLAAFIVMGGSFFGVELFLFFRRRRAREVVSLLKDEKRRFEVSLLNLKGKAGSAPIDENWAQEFLLEKCRDFKQALKVFGEIRYDESESLEDLAYVATIYNQRAVEFAKVYQTAASFGIASEEADEAAKVISLCTWPKKGAR